MTTAIRISIYVFSGLLAIASILIGLYFIIYSKNLFGSGTAKVIDVSCSGSNNTNCTAKIQFVSSDGKQYTSTINGNYTIGQEINIKFDPNYPFQIVSPMITNIIIGVILIPLGLLVLRYLYQKIKNEN